MRGRVWPLGFHGLIFEMILGILGEILGRFWALLGSLGVLWEHSGVLLVRSWALLDVLGVFLGRFWALFGFLGVLGGMISEDLGPNAGKSWEDLGRTGDRRANLFMRFPFPR